MALSEMLSGRFASIRNTAPFLFCFFPTWRECVCFLRQDLWDALLISITQNICSHKQLLLEDAEPEGSTRQFTYDI